MVYANTLGNSTEHYWQLSLLLTVLQSLGLRLGMNITSRRGSVNRRRNFAKTNHNYPKIFIQRYFTNF